MTRILTASSLDAAFELLLGLSGNGECIAVADSRFAPLLPDAWCVAGGEGCKTLGKVEALWRFLQRQGATRRSMLVAVGGGSITDMAGFAASCFKRGIDTAYIPTTILAAVDASIGGKTAINFGGLKNEIGTFHQPSAIVMVPELWQSLPYSELANGYGEILKTAMLQGHEAFVQAQLAAQRLVDGHEAPFSFELIKGCAEFKQRIVEQDPFDRSIRRNLNLGHTFGHALEALSLSGQRQAPLSHGHAVAIGLVAMACLSNEVAGFAGKWVDRIAAIVRGVYPPYSWSCPQADEVIGLMGHDKKNVVTGQPLFILLSDIGSPLPPRSATAPQIRTALDITRDLLAI